MKGATQQRKVSTYRLSSHQVGMNLTERMSKKGEIGVDELELRFGLNAW